MTGNSLRARFFAAALAASLIVTACSGAAATPAPTYSGPSLNIITITPYPTSADGSRIYAAPTVPSWFSIQMTDVNSGKPFKIADFAGKVVLVETMATWCPTCQGQMSQVQELEAGLGSGSEFVVVTLDVDPNEDAALLKKYTDKNGFNWHVAIAPSEVVRFLVTQYDEAFLNPPLQPMLFIDKQGGVWSLPTGVKSAVSLRKTLDRYLTQ